MLVLFHTQTEAPDVARFLQKKSISFYNLCIILLQAKEEKKEKWKKETNIFLSTHHILSTTLCIFSHFDSSQKRRVYNVHLQVQNSCLREVSYPVQTWLVTALALMPTTESNAGVDFYQIMLPL